MVTAAKGLKKLIREIYTENPSIGYELSDLYHNLRKEILLKEYDSRFHVEHRELQTEAHRLLDLAISKGKVLVSDSCWMCGTTEAKICAHLSDYSKPYDVVWLCPSCHSILHRRTPESAVRAEERKRRNAEYWDLSKPLPKRRRHVKS